MDKNSQNLQPKAFVEEDLGTTAILYSYPDGKLLLETCTRDLADTIRQRLNEGPREALKAYIVAQLHLWGYTVGQKKEHNKKEVETELPHLFDSEGVSTIRIHLFIYANVLR